MPIAYKYPKESCNECGTTPDEEIIQLEFTDLGLKYEQCASCGDGVIITESMPIKRLDIPMYEKQVELNNKRSNAYTEMSEAREFYYNTPFVLPEKQEEAWADFQAKLKIWEEL